MSEPIDTEYMPVLDPINSTPVNTGHTLLAEIEAWRKAQTQLNAQYQMALDDIGKIGEALGLNSSQYMTHSPQEVAGLVLQRALDMVMARDVMQSERDAAQAEAKRLADDRKNLLRLLHNCMLALPDGIFKREAESYLDTALAAEGKPSTRFQSAVATVIKQDGK